jgi:hypothetical protein
MGQDDLIEPLIWVLLAHPLAFPIWLSHQFERLHCRLFYSRARAWRIETQRKAVPGLRRCKSFYEIRLIVEAVVRSSPGDFNVTLMGTVWASINGFLW